MSEKTIWTLGHSNRSFDELLQLLQVFDIGLLADIRSYPGSKRLPHFNKTALEVELPKNSINYLHLRDLGGGKIPRHDSLNTAWAFSGFRGYADHMETNVFKKAAGQLEKEAGMMRTAYMCAEAPWRSCHRSLLSDYLKARGWKVVHIVHFTSAEEHPYTKEARLENGQLSYHKPDLFS